MGAAPTVIHLELARSGESLTGRAYDDGGASAPFDGRLGLLAVIDSLVEAFEARHARHEEDGG